MPFFCYHNYFLPVPHFDFVDPPSSSKGQPVDQRMSATGFEEPDLTYTLPTAAPASAPPPPPAHNAEGSSRSGVEVKVVRIEIPKSRVLRMNENCKRYLYHYQ